jgi:tetratricopeptide (TPR) repeat protein
LKDELAMRRRSTPSLVLACLVAFAPISPGQDSPTDERDRAVMNRFLSVVEKSPRRGTALDRVYGYHVERGSLDAFLKTYQDRTVADPKDGAAWLMIGLVESQRGRDAAAVAALRQAESTRPDDPMPCYYLGQSMVLVGQPDDAAQAFERAITRKPNRADLLEIFQALGRVYQRAHRNEQALAVWSRLERIFPDDPRVQEQIAASLAEEAQPDQALPRYEALAKSTKDRFRQVQFQVDAAELKVRLNRTADALADFEGLLGRLDPESWLYREVRRKIEEIYTKSDDLAGLAAYYEGWIKKTPDDVEAMSRLGKALTSQGRLAEARGWYEKAVNLAPTRRDLRASLIEQLLIEKKFVEAAAQYEAIAKNDPNNPDVLREWGRVLLRDTGKPEAERKKAAASIWRRLTDARPDDPSTMVAVADLFRSAEMVDEAVALYQGAIAKAPGSPQYAEYLGEFYHRLKKPAEAVATWSKMAAPPNRNAKTLGRLAEVLSGFGYKNEALAAATEAAGLDLDDFDLQLRLADHLHAAEKLDLEAKQLEVAAKASDSEEQREGVLDRQIKNFQVSGALPSRIDLLKKELDAGTNATSDRWRVLARYLEADQKPGEALAAAHKAVTLDPKSVPSLVMIARLDEATGNLSGAADVYRKLAEVDRRARTEYLTGVARLEARLGRKDAALKAGRDLLAAAPGQLDNHQFFAELCFQLGQVDEGLDALRRAVRLNEADPKALLGLAETLATQFRTEEAIEMFWRAFEKSNDLEGRLSVVTKLTSLYLQRNQFDRLIARLERQGREADRQREMTMCLAQAYSASGDYGTARSELERLLSTNPRDTKLLFQLSVLSESEGDASTAAKFQKQLVDVAPGDEANSRLASLYLQGGEISEAEALWTRLTATGEPESYRVLMAIDSLLGSGKKEAVLGITENLLRKRPESWEALYREGQALAGLTRPSEAEARFRKILQLKANDDEVGAVARARKRGVGQSTDPNAPSSTNYYAPSKSFPLQDRISKVYNIRGASGIDGRFTTGSAWSPDDLGQAKMAAVGWLFSLATRAGTQDAFLAEMRSAAEKSPTDPRPQWNLYYLQLLRIEFADIFEASKGLAKAAPTDPPAQFAFLNSLPIRAQSGQNVIINATPGAADTTPPLPDSELDLVLTSFRALKAQKPDWAHAAILTAVTDELKRSKRAEALDQFYKSAIESSADAESAVSILRVAAERGDVDNVIKLFDRYERLLTPKSTSTNNLYVYYGGYYTYSSTPADSFCRAMLNRRDAKADGDVFRLFDHYLQAARRPDRITKRVRAIASASANANNNNSRFQVWTGKNVKFSSITYPMPNPYYDLAGIQVLRNAYELFKRDDLLSDLTTHLKKSLETGNDVDKAYTHLALCYLNWWEDNKDEALVELSEAGKASKSDPELLLALAELRSERNEPEEALRVADSFEPLDQKAMQRREVLAIRLAVVTGDVARARKAAERLFGLRLDADTQVQLASQMHQLGMHELAEAVLGRARRRAGGNLAALVSLMLQYQRQGKPEVAVQVANQVLRRNPARAQPGYYDEGAVARTEAVQVLARSGKIKEMITRLEEQVQRTPGSLQLHQRLADYYKAAGEKDKAKVEYEAIVKLRPDDSRLRFQIASDLAQASENAAAVEHYTAALKKEPSLLGSNFYEIQQAFQQANKFDDLVKIVEEADVRSIGQIYYLARIIQAVIQDKAKRDRGLALFAKAWKAFPGQRENLFAYVSSEEVWQLPEMYDYLREVVIPAEGRKSVPPWHGVAETLRNSGNGRMTTTSGRLIDLAERRGKLEAISDEIKRAEKRLPAWRGGKALQGLLLARRGRIDEARTLLAPLADTKQADPAPAVVRQMIGQEWEGVPALRPLALALYEGSVKDSEFSDYLFYSSPVQRLVEMYRVAGRLDDARRELLAASRNAGSAVAHPSGAAYWKIEDRSEIASRLIALGFPADAARIYDETLADTEAIALARDWGSDDDSQANQLRKGLEFALEALDRDNLAATLKAQLASPLPVDLLLLVQPRELEDATVASLLHAAIRSLAKTPAGLDEVQKGLAKRLETQPGDIPTRVAQTLTTIQAGSPEAIKQAVETLAKLVESSPLERLEGGERANSRQRLEAARQLGVWLVARECKSRPELKDASKALIDRSLEAGSRQADPSWTFAMLRESAQDAFDRGDRAEAEASWSKMLKSILARPTESKVDPARKSGVPVATLDRFERATRLAKLASSRGMIGFSLKAALEPLRGGPPVVPLTIRSSNNVGIARNPADRAKEQAIDKAVEARLAELEIAWENSHAPAIEVYQVLRNVVLPEGRPSEVFAYPRPFGEGSADKPTSVAGLLVRWAIRADRVEDLRKQVEERSKQPTAEAPARSILVQLDLARRDFEGANKGLQALATLLAKDKLQSTAEIVALAGLPALTIPETEAAALPVLELATASFVASGAEEASVKVQLALAHRHFAKQRAEEGRKRVQATLEALERATASGQAAYRYYGNGFQTRRENLQVVAAEYAKGGQWDEAMEALGQSADSPIVPNRGVNPAPPFALVAMARHLSALPPAERYEKLRVWTMPNETRATIRNLAAFAPVNQTPEAFGRFAPIGDGSGLTSTLELLVLAAKEAGKLDTLATEVRQTVDKKLDDAETLQTLVEIARRQTAEVEPKLKAMLVEWSKKADEAPTTNFGNPPAKPAPWSDYLRVRAALSDPKLAEIASKLADHSKSKLSDAGIQGHLRQDVVASLVRTAGQDAGLSWWDSPEGQTAASSRQGTARGVWIAQGGHIHHRGGSAIEQFDSPSRAEKLVFRVPLTGRFTFRVDASGEGAEIGYGGLMMAPSYVDNSSNRTYRRMAQASQARGSIRAIGSTQSMPRPTLTAPSLESNRLSIEVEPGSVRFLCNGHLVFEDRDPNPATPWIVLGASGEADVDFRNLEISGQPNIPRELALTSNDRLEGWLSDFYDETRPDRNLGPDGRLRTSPLGGATRPSSVDKDWSSQGGEIVGRRVPDAGGEAPAQSRLAFHRPLRPGESVAYEFYHEPDAMTVHPALGRLAFLLEPGGVRLHWMTDGPDFDVSGLPASNVVDDPSGRRGPAALSLKPGEWNKVKLALVGRTVEIELNGAKVFERDLESGNDRLFSFYHDKGRTIAKVRNVVLKGDWPESIPVEDLSRRREDGTSEARRRRSLAIGEAAFARDAGDVLKRANTLPPAQRYEVLLAWVLPSDDHPGFRLAGEFSPTNPTNVPTPPSIPPGATRSEFGGTFEAPAFALFEAASEANTLDDLVGRIERAPVSNDLDRRGQLALKALAFTKQGHHEEAKSCLAKLKPLLEAVEPDAPETERWPEFVAIADFGVRHYSRDAAKPLAKTLIASVSQKDFKPVGDVWRLHGLQFAALLDRADTDVPQYTDNIGLPDWVRVTLSTTKSRGTGAPLPVWFLNGGTLVHLPGHDRDYVYFRTPLRGDFEVSGESTGRPLQFAYGGIAVGVAPDGKEVVVSSLGAPPKRVTLDPPLAPTVVNRKVRLTVKGGILATYLDDRKLFETGLPANPDPWLALYQAAEDSGSLRNVKLLGNPTIPDKLDLSDQPDLLGWLAGDELVPSADSDPSWRKRGDEIFGRNSKDAAGSKQESLLQYHRPIAEDGEISYEFFHEPGKADVAPALDRLAFLVEPDGIKLHRITDAPFDRTGLKIEDARETPAKLDIKPGAWNRMTLAVVGDKVSLRLNDGVIFERTIEPTNQRTFGLFHFADEGEARVRNLTYRGNWPKQKPGEIGF